MSGHRLYTPDVLAAAVSLSSFPLAADLPLRGEARSKSCGSHIAIGLALDEAGCVAKVGMAAHACAIGQASAAVFAKGVEGLTPAEIGAARDALRCWVREDGDMPDWPGLDLIAPAHEFPARHGAMLLAWEAAVNALQS